MFVEYKSQVEELSSCREEVSTHFARHNDNYSGMVNIFDISYHEAVEIPTPPHLTNYWKTNTQLTLLSISVINALGSIFDATRKPFSYQDFIYTHYKNYEILYNGPERIQIAAPPNQSSNYVGTLLNIPIEWLEYIPITSFLLLLPRIATDFCINQQLTWQLTSSGCVLFPFMPETPEVSRPLGKLVSSLGWPIYHLQDDDNYFWQFLYLLLYVANNKEFIEEFLVSMQISEINGFHTWLYRTDFTVPHFSELIALLNKGISKYIPYGGYCSLRCMQDGKIKGG